jgi:protein-disulfide isomerase
MAHKCDECGEEFDTKRGLHIHQSQKHDSETEQVQNHNKEPDSLSNPGITFTTKQFGAATFAFGILLGLVLGGLGGAAAAGMMQNTQAIAPSEGTDTPTDPGNTGNTGDTGNTGNQGETETIDMSEIEMEGEPVLGQEDAPVTMIVYEDFQCPFCKRFEEGAVSQIVSNYVESGDVKIVWKDRPLTRLHPWAKPAAEAMECVHREGGNDVFWTLKDKIFSNQNQLSTSNAQSQIKSWAADEGVSESAIQSCIDSGDAMSEVEADSTEGQQLGASGTPTSFVNGQKLVGAQPFSRFETVIEEELGN